MPFIPLNRLMRGIVLLVIALELLRVRIWPEWPLVRARKTIRAALKARIARVGSIFIAVRAPVVKTIVKAIIGFIPIGAKTAIGPRIALKTPTCAIV